MRIATVSVAEAAKQLDLLPSTIIELAHAGKLHIKFDSQAADLFEVTVDSLERYARRLHLVRGGSLDSISMTGALKLHGLIAGAQQMRPSRRRLGTPSAGTSP